MKQKILSNVFMLLMLLTNFGGFGCTDTSSKDPEKTEATTESTSLINLCALLTPNDIKQTLRTSVNAGEANNEALGQCSWTATEDSKLVVLLTLEKAALQSFEDFVWNFGEEFGGENPPHEEFHPVDIASSDWSMYDAKQHMVRTFKNENVLEVSAPSMEEAAIVTLAKLAMGRLP